MKRLLAFTLAAYLCSGCALWPKKVEYGQKKVKAVPELPAKAIEHQRQAAQYVAVKTDQVEKAAIAEDCPPAVLVPAAEAAGAAAALTESLGPAEKPWLKDVTNLVQTLHADQAKLNLKIEKYREDVEPLVGKKIEGTGVIQIGYFWNLLLVFGGFALLIGLIWAGLKIYGTMNPAVGLGVNAAGRVASKVLSQGLSEVVAGGERFKQYVENSHLDEKLKAWIAGTFTQAQMEAQSQNVQTVVTKLTAQAPITTPVAAPVSAALGGAPEVTPEVTPEAAPIAAKSASAGTSLPQGIKAEIVAWFESLLTPPAASQTSPAPAQVSAPSPVASSPAPAAVASTPHVPAPAQRITAPPTA